MEKLLKTLRKSGFSFTLQLVNDDDHESQIHLNFIAKIKNIVYH